VGTIIKYPGAKATLAPRLVAGFPPHRCYLEPFFGSGAVLFAKPRARLETVNDLDGRVCALFRALRDRAPDLAEAVFWTPWSREEYRAVGEADRTGDDVEDARRWLVRCWQSHGTHLDRRNGWRWASGKGDDGGTRDYAGEWARLPDRLLAAAARLRGVQVECAPALEVIARHAVGDCLIYADPPYPLSERADRYYRHEMTDDDHRALLDALDAHPGPVVLSGYACPLYDDRLGHWQREEIAATAEGGRARTEIVWRNARAARPRLFA
jgi:DNA adenine methylase